MVRTGCVSEERVVSMEKKANGDTSKVRVLKMTGRYECRGTLETVTQFV